MGIIVCNQKLWLTWVVWSLQLVNFPTVSVDLWELLYSSKHRPCRPRYIRFVPSGIRETYSGESVVSCSLKCGVVASCQVQGQTVNKQPKDRCPTDPSGIPMRHQSFWLVASCVFSPLLPKWGPSGIPRKTIQQLVILRICPACLAELPNSSKNCVAYLTP